MLSVASLWEIAIKTALGKLKFPLSPKEVLAILDSNGIELLPIAPAHGLYVAKLDFHHRDPFDRLLIAQASLEKLPIVTDDGAYRSYGVDLIW